MCPDSQPVKSNLQHAERPDNLKDQINLLLWQTLPDRTRMGRAEEIATEFYGIIDAEWQRQD